MSDGQPESGGHSIEHVENPEPEADSELSGVCEDGEDAATVNGGEQPEDECDIENTGTGNVAQNPSNDLQDSHEQQRCGQRNRGGDDAYGEGLNVSPDSTESARCKDEAQGNSVGDVVSAEGGPCDQPEGEDAEGIVPCVQNSSSESDSFSPEHERFAPETVSDEAESDSFGAEGGSEIRPDSGEQILSNDEKCDGINDSVESGMGDVTANSLDELGSIDQVVNSSEQISDAQIVERSTQRDSAAAEDDSPDRENGQAPECDRDFVVAAEPQVQAQLAQDEALSCLEDVQVESSVTVDSRSGANGNHCDSNSVNDSPEDVQSSEESDSESVLLAVQSGADVSVTNGNHGVSDSMNDCPEDAQFAQAQGNPESMDEVEEAVELCEDYCEPDNPQNDESGGNSSTVSTGSVSGTPSHSVSSPSQGVSSDKNGTFSPLKASNLSSSVKHSPKGSPKAAKEVPDFDDALLSELDEALHSQSDQSEAQKPSEMPEASQQIQQSESHEQFNGTAVLPNGLNLEGLSDSPHLKPIMDQLMRMQKHVEDSQKKLSRLQTEKQQQAQALATTVKERDVYLAQVQSLKSRCPDDLYLPQIKELEYTIAQQQNEMRGMKDKLSSHDSAAKRAVSTLQNELKVRVDQVTKMYEECVREKDSMVIKYAESEHKNIECQKAVEKMEAKVKESAKDRESMVAKVKSVKAEKNKAVADMDTKSTELSQAVKEIEKLRETLSSADVRIKWSQNKLRAELEAHKDTKANLEKTNIKVKEAREETQQIRRDCQAMIKTYQESEEIKSNSLDKELKVKETELIIQRQERSDREERYQMTAKELESLKAKHKDSLEELITLRDKVRCLGEEVDGKESRLAQSQEKIQRQDKENRNLQDKAGTLDQLQEDFNRAQEMIKTLDRDIQDLMVTNKDLQQDMEGCRRRESELLDLTEKLSRKNAKLQSDNTNLNNQVVTLSSEAEKWKMEIQELDTNVQSLEDSLKTETRERKEETQSLKSQLEESTKHMENYRQQMEDEKDLNRTLKRKHVNNVKDLTRQLQQARKRLETLENHTERDTTSMGSRTSSNGSLNTMGDTGNSQNNTNSNHNPHTNSRQPSQEPEYPVITEQVEVDKQVLIERIVRLQKAHARKNEKLEFLDDHIHQLVDEIQKKNRIIQNYVMREESGTLAPEYMDENKLRVRTEAQALLAKKGGIMASVYSSHQQDGAMTIDLSLEINKKLQSVLEDTLLKNITLKESLDTLGTEIARLSQENRQLQLKIQELPH